MHEELPANLKIQAPCSSRLIFNLIRISLRPFTIYHEAHLSPLCVLYHRDIRKSKILPSKHFLICSEREIIDEQNSRIYRSINSTGQHKNPPFHPILFFLWFLLMFYQIRPYADNLNTRISSWQTRKNRQINENQQNTREEWGKHQNKRNSTK